MSLTPIVFRSRVRRTGFTRDVARKLFKPMASTKHSGMGVGLSISRTIIEGHGGQISVQPNPGGGSVFRFTLRAVDRELNDAD